MTKGAVTAVMISSVLLRLGRVQAFLPSGHEKLGMGFLSRGYRTTTLRPIFSTEDGQIDGMKAHEMTQDNLGTSSLEQTGRALNISLTDDCVLAIDPSSLEISVREDEEVPNPETTALAKRGPGFVKMFRGSANYIANHRHTLAVYHIPGSLLEWGDNSFRDLMDDIALTWLLGMKVVLVAGCRHQINKRLGDRSGEMHFGMCVTDAETLRVVKEEAGYVRFEVERQLARSLRLHGGFGTGTGTYDGNVVSGNFYSAQPFGVLEGIDYKYTGFVRRVEVEKIRDVNNSRDICLLTPLGVSPSGEVFNVNSESLAANVAGALDASKIVFFTEKEMILRNRKTGKTVQNMRLKDVQNLLIHKNVKIDKRGSANVNNMEGLERQDPERLAMLLTMGWAMKAVEQGVQRAHIITPTQGALVQELYTRDGSGTLISRDLYEGIRPAIVDDVAGISDLIQPLIKMGTLVDRSKATLEKEIDTYFVYTRDSLIVACGQLKRFEDGFIEIGCLVVSKSYRKGGRGDAMLGYLERLCVQSGAAKVFVLSTQTMEWFLERGFQEVTVDRLPPCRQDMYNSKRNSKIYLKKIESDRDLDTAELWWNR